VELPVEPPVAVPPPVEPDAVEAPAPVDDPLPPAAEPEVTPPEETPPEVFPPDVDELAPVVPPVDEVEALPRMQVAPATQVGVQLPMSQVWGVSFTI
jgi:hypothetical protein